MSQTKHRTKPPLWEAVSIEGGGIEVRAKIGAFFYTIADVYCTPDSSATKNAELIAAALNLGRPLANDRRVD